MKIGHKGVPYNESHIKFDELNQGLFNKMKHYSITYMFLSWNLIYHLIPQSPHWQQSLFSVQRCLWTLWVHRVGDSVWDPDHHSLLGHGNEPDFHGKLEVLRSSWILRHTDSYQSELVMSRTNTKYSFESNEGHEHKVHTMDMLWETFQWILPLYMKPISFQSKASVVCPVTTAAFIDFCLKN